MLELDPVHTLAFGGVVLFAGYGLRRAVPALARMNVPPPMIGGLLMALAALVAHERGVTLVRFDTALQAPLMIAFFTSIGCGASLSLLRIGGPQVLRFFALATVFAVAQNVVGAAAGAAFGLHPLFGVLAGSVALTGGPATGLAFAPLFEQAGVTGAASIAVAAAMAGIVAGGLVGGPVGTILVERRLTATGSGGAPARAGSPPEPAIPVAVPADIEAYALLKTIVVLLVVMWAGSWVSRGAVALGLTLPAYVGAMLVAAAVRNLDDATGWIGMSQRLIDDLGSVALSLFLVTALMTLKLWDLAGLALPLLVILLAQVLLVVVVCLGPVFRAMGRDYEAAVMSAGFVGFMLGTTANAMAVMRALTERYGAAPRAFLVAPMVGAFFIDFTNALIVTACLNLWG